MEGYCDLLANPAVPIIKYYLPLEVITPPLSFLCILSISLVYSTANNTKFFIAESLVALLAFLTYKGYTLGSVFYISLNSLSIISYN
jgi:hypothetical protein